MSRVLFHCNVCELDEIFVDAMTWDWPARDRYAVCFCLVHTPVDLARLFDWANWLRWLFWNPLLRATHEAKP